MADEDDEIVREDHPTYEDALRGLRRYRGYVTQWQEWADKETERLGLNHPSLIHGREGAQELLTAALSKIQPARPELDEQIERFLTRWMGEGDPEMRDALFIVATTELRALVLGCSPPPGPKAIVHHLHGGVTACRMPGLPRDWPDGNKWSPEWSEVDCPACKAKQP